MHAQVVYFDGPRSPELVAAGERAGKQRLTPAVLADEQVCAGHVGTFVLRRPDGGEMVVVIAEDESVIDRAGEILMNTQLLPGEDPALLPGPDRIERMPVIHAIERGRLTLA